MNYMLLLIILFSEPKPEGYPNIGDLLPENARKTDLYTLISSSQFENFYEFEMNRIIYKVAINTSGKMIYISTIDKDFKSVEGYQIGIIYEKIKHAKHSLSQIDGYAFQVKLDQGWIAAFIQGESMTEGDLQDSTPIMWFEKR